MRVQHLGVSIAASIVILTSLAFLTNTQAKRFIFHCLSCVALHFYALFLLSLKVQSDDDNHKRRPDSNRADHSGRYTVLTRLFGTLGAVYTFLLAAIFPGSHPLSTCVLRVLCFHYACKLLDLTVARASRPPRQMKNGKAFETRNDNARLRYIWLLFTEYRYFSFDIVAVQKGREETASKAWTYGPPIVLPIVVFLHPSMEVKCLFGLMVVYLGLELIHKLAHSSCQHSLFWQPFAAPSIADFWKTHWHSGAAPWLYSLGYKPTRRLVTPVLGPQVGRAVAVLATFSLSGIWHGWTASTLTTQPLRTGTWMCAIFILQGMLCLVEQAVPRSWHGGLVHRAIIWGASMWALARWIDHVKTFSRIPELTQYV